MISFKFLDSHDCLKDSGYQDPVDFGADPGNQDLHDFLQDSGYQDPCSPKACLGQNSNLNYRTHIEQRSNFLPGKQCNATTTQNFLTGNGGVRSTCKRKRTAP